MAAFCGCCGAEITDRAEACSVCGTPRHGMMPAGLPVSIAEAASPACCQKKDSSSKSHRLSRPA